jgi:hypothetical protein
MNFVKKYLRENFPKGAGLAEFGCSVGYSGYSMLVALDDINHEKKYKICCYDFPEVIEKIKHTSYKIEKDQKNESVLWNSTEAADKNECNKIFYKYFNIDPNPASKTSNQIFVTPNHDKTNGLIKFQQGDIREIDKILTPGQNSVILFQNALYHILENYFEYDSGDYDDDYFESLNLEAAKKLFKKINKMLPENGIFVMGNVGQDHMFLPEYDDNSTLKYVNNERKRVYDSSPVHKALIETGFEPVFYEKLSDSTPYGKYKDIYIPSVWKKKPPKPCGIRPDLQGHL